MNDIEHMLQIKDEFKHLFVSITLFHYSTVSSTAMHNVFNVLKNYTFLFLLSFIQTNTFLIFSKLNNYKLVCSPVIKFFVFIKYLVYQNAHYQNKIVIIFIKSKLTVGSKCLIKLRNHRFLCFAMPRAK